MGSVRYTVDVHEPPVYRNTGRVSVVKGQNVRSGGALRHRMTCSRMGGGGRWDRNKEVVPLRS